MELHMGIIKDYINERKRCNEIIELINIEDWTALNKFKLFGDDNFGLKNKNFIKKMNRKLEEKVINNPSLLSNINLVDIKSDHLNKFVLSTNPDAIEILINQKSKDFMKKKEKDLNLNLIMKKMKIHQLKVFLIQIFK